MVQGFSGKKRFLVRFQDGCKKYIAPNQLTIVIEEKITAGGTRGAHNYSDT